MDSGETFIFILNRIMSWLPQLLVLIGGVVFCLSQMSKNPRASRTALSGLAVMLLTAVLGIGIGWIQANLTVWTNGDIQKIGYILFVTNLIQGVIWSIGLALLIYAVFVGRGERQ